MVNKHTKFDNNFDIRCQLEHFEYEMNRTLNLKLFMTLLFLINYDDACFPFSLGGNVPNILHQVSVPIINNDKCQNMFIKSGHKKKVRESFLCAGYDKGEKDSCEVRILI